MAAEGQDKPQLDEKVEVKPDLTGLQDKVDRLKLQKTSVKSSLTKARNKMTALLENEFPIRQELRDGISKVVSLQSKAVKIIGDLAQSYKKLGQKELYEKTMKEIDATEAPVNEATEKVQAYLDNTPSTISSVSGSIGIGAMFETYKPTAHVSFSQQPGASTPKHSALPSPSHTPHNGHKTSNIHSQVKKHDVQQPSNDRGDKNKVANDMWRQLKRVSIPVFNGNVREYEGWRAAFMSCVDCAPATNVYKLLQLKQYVDGEPAELVGSLGHSTAAYDVALERLDRKYGGKRRLIALKLDEVSNFRPIRSDVNADFEKFADMLDVLVVTLKSHDKVEELVDGCLYSLLLKKLTEEMLVQYNRFIFEQQRQESVETLREWVLQEAQFRTIASEAKSGFLKPISKERTKMGTFFGSNNADEDKTCPVCNADHEILQCTKFKALSVDDRYQTVRDLYLCFRCLGSGHLGRNCRKSRPCGIDGCTGTHHQLLHTKTRFFQRKDNNSPTQSQTAKSVTMSTIDNDGCYFSALRTVPVILKHGDRRMVVNALLDDASTKTYINEDVAEELGLKGKTQAISVNVLNSRTETFMSRKVQFELSSMDGSITVNMSGLTTTKVTGTMPVIDWRKHQHKWTHLSDIPFPKVTSKPVVDVLVGMDYLMLHSSLRDVCGQPGEPVARLTPLGWTCVGNVGNFLNHTHGTFLTVVQDRVHDNLDQMLQNLWEVEQFPQAKDEVTPTDQSVLDRVKDTLVFQDGRYEIGIPWTTNSEPLHDNYNMAYSRLLCTEKKLAKDEVVDKSYSGVIEQYLQKGYIRIVPECEISETKWYLPHFPVVKLDRETTKVRIVFDASAKDKGVSLNDVIEPGPKLQNDLFEILLRFRKLQVALVCDIAEMYLQIGLLKVDRPFFRFLWRSDKTQSPDVYEFSRVVFGVNCSPFLAQYVTQEHARTHMTELPLASETVTTSTYMDDSMDSVKDEETGLQLYNELKTLWSSAGMHARKWNSNSEVVVSEIPVCDRLKEIDIQMSELPSMKTLGLMWNPVSDCFTFSNIVLTQERKFTKRSFLKETARLFDPLGLLVPFTVRAKIILQDMWLSGVDWDSMVNPELEMKARSWHTELQALPSLFFPRCICQGDNNDTHLHAFVDASEVAYGAVIYGVSKGESSVSSRLVAAKSRVAPLKAQSIPRLELMAAVLGVKLLLSITHALGFAMKTVTMWSDSNNVLCWIRNQSRCFKPFVANRVGYIHEHTTPSQWKYVPTKLNPADILSRGSDVRKLVCAEWLNGPEFLILDETHYPEQPQRFTESGKTELKSQKHITLMSRSSEDLLSWRLNPLKFSDLNRLCRILAWTLRFVTNIRTQPEQRKKGELYVEEILDAETRVLCDAQRDSFPEYNLLENDKTITANSKLCRLQPFIGEDGLMRSSGRLRHAETLPFDTRCPIILARHHWITKLVVKSYHEKNGHLGTNQTLSSLSSRFWVMSAREEIREWENECAKCKRDKAKPASQIMSDLPQERVKAAKAFEQTAVDFAGPFLTIQGRGKARQKRYMCLFTCLATRAVHLEIAFGLDTDSFLRAFFRMVDRRGLPKELLSDNGTNFVGAARELRQMVRESQTAQASLASRGVTWKFNPPQAPHFGGVFESMIKSAKRAIYAVLSASDVTDEELMSAFTGAEALLNSRPLTYQSAHPEDDVPLTPNHFLIGQLGGHFAAELDNDTVHPTKRWRRVQELQRHFWKRWMREWLPSLNVRNKWFSPERDLQVGDVVLLVSPDTPRGSWPLGKIVKTYPGKDGHVRVVDVNSGNTVLTRPITKVCPLEWNSD